MLRGRSLTPADRANAPEAAVINKTMASHVFPGEDPIGRRIGVDGNSPGEVRWVTSSAFRATCGSTASRTRPSTRSISR